MSLVASLSIIEGVDAPSENENEARSIEPLFERSNARWIVSPAATSEAFTVRRLAGPGVPAPICTVPDAIVCEAEVELVNVANVPRPAMPAAAASTTIEVSSFVVVAELRHAEAMPLMWGCIVISSFPLIARTGVSVQVIGEGQRFAVVDGLARAGYVPDVVLDHDRVRLGVGVDLGERDALAEKAGRAVARVRRDARAVRGQQRGARVD